MELQSSQNIPISPEKLRAAKSILVIDDSKDSVMLSKIILEMAGYKVSTASSGQEALNILSDINEVNLILLDMQLGDLSGLEFLEILEQQNPEVSKNVPVIFLTGMDQVPKSRAKGFLRKPVENTKLLKTVNSFLEVGDSDAVDNNHH